MKVDVQDAYLFDIRVSDNAYIDTDIYMNNDLMQRVKHPTVAQIDD